MNRIIIRSNIYELNYPYDDNIDYKNINKLLEEDCRKFGFVRVLLFKNMKDANNWSKNAIFNPNILSIDDLV